MLFRKWAWYSINRRWDTMPHSPGGYTYSPDYTYSPGYTYSPEVFHERKLVFLRALSRDSCQHCAKILSTKLGSISLSALIYEYTLLKCAWFTAWIHGVLRYGHFYGFWRPKWSIWVQLTSNLSFPLILM